MFSALSRKLSEQLTIQQLIDHLKVLIKKETIPEVLESYPNSKLDIQRTFHLKLIKNMINRNQYLYSQFHEKNLSFQFMITDLINNFENMNLIEKNDFMEFYKQSLTMGNYDFLKEEQFFRVSKCLNETTFNKNTFSPILSQTFYNFGFLGIKNPFIKEIKFKVVNNIRYSDLLQIFKAITIEPYYFNHEFLDEIYQHFHLIFGRFSSVENLLKVFENYSFVCEVNNLKPKEDIMIYFKNFIETIINQNEKNLLRIFAFYNRRMLKPLVNRYKPQFESLVFKNIRNNVSIAETMRVALIVFADDRDKIDSILKKSKDLYCESAESLDKKWCANILYSMLYCRASDPLIFESIIKQYKQERISGKNLIVFSIISKILNIKPPTFENIEYTNISIDHLSIESILHLMLNLIPHDNNKENHQEYIDLCRNTLISRKKNSPNISQITDKLIRIANLNTPNEIFNSI